MDPIPYVRSKARPLKLRDMASGESRDVGPTAWVKFGELPRNIYGGEDHDLHFRLAKTPEDVAAIEAENAAMAEVEARRLEAQRARAAAKAAKAAEVSAPVVEEPAPKPEAQQHGRRNRR